MRDLIELCDVVREASFAIYKYRGNGHLEKIYENSLTNRLRKHGVNDKLILRLITLVGAMPRCGMVGKIVHD